MQERRQSRQARPPLFPAYGQTPSATQSQRPSEVETIDLISEDDDESSTLDAATKAAIASDQEKLREFLQRRGPAFLKPWQEEQVRNAEVALAQHQLAQGEFDLDEDERRHCQQLRFRQALHARQARTHEALQADAAFRHAEKTRKAEEQAIAQIQRSALRSLRQDSRDRSSREDSSVSGISSDGDEDLPGNSTSFAAPSVSASFSLAGRKSTAQVEEEKLLLQMREELEERSASRSIWSSGKMGDGSEKYLKTSVRKSGNERLSVKTTDAEDGESKSRDQSVEATASSARKLRLRESSFIAPMVVKSSRRPPFNKNRRKETSEVTSTVETGEARAFAPPETQLAFSGKSLASLSESIQDFAVHIDGLDKPIVFQVGNAASREAKGVGAFQGLDAAESDDQDGSEFLSSSGESCESEDLSKEEVDGISVSLEERWRRERRHLRRREDFRLRLLNQHDYLLAQCRRNPEEERLWMQLIAWQEMLTRVLHLHSEDANALLERQLALVDCGARHGGSENGSPSVLSLLFLRKLFSLLHQGVATTASAWLSLARLSCEAAVAASEEGIRKSISVDSGALPRTVLTAAVISKQYSGNSVDVILSEILCTAERSVREASSELRRKLRQTSEASSSSSRQETNTACRDARRRLRATQNVCLAILRDIVLGMVSTLDSRGGRNALAAARLTSLAHLALLHASDTPKNKDNQDTQLSGEAPPERSAAFETLKKLWLNGGWRLGELKVMNEDFPREGVSEADSAFSRSLCSLVESFLSDARGTEMGAPSLESEGEAGVEFKEFCLFAAAEEAASFLGWRTRRSMSGAFYSEDRGEEETDAVAVSRQLGMRAGLSAERSARLRREASEAAEAASRAAKEASQLATPSALLALQSAAKQAADASRRAEEADKVATKVALEAACLDLQVLSPYSRQIDSADANTQWTLLEPSLAAADALLQSTLTDPKTSPCSCCGTCPYTAEEDNASFTRSHSDVAYALVVSILDFMGSPSLLRFPSHHPRLHLATRCLNAGEEEDSVDAKSALASDANCLFNGINAFGFAVPRQCLRPATSKRTIQLATWRCRAWSGEQHRMRHLLENVDSSQPDAPQTKKDSIPLGESSGPFSSDMFGNCCTRRMLAVSVCAEALRVFPDDSLLLHCMLSLVPTQKVFRLVLKRFEGRPFLWIVYAASLLQRSLALTLSSTSQPSSVEASKSEKLPTAQALLSQARKVMATCISAFATDASLAASWVFLEMTLASPADKALRLLENAKKGSELMEEIQTALASLAELRIGWPVLATLKAEAAFDRGGEKTGSSYLPLEGWGVTPFALEVAVAFAEENFASLETLRLEEFSRGDSDDATGDSRRSLRFDDSRLREARRVLVEKSGRRAEAQSFSSPFQTTQQWSCLYLALVVEASLHPKEKAQRQVWRLFESCKEQTAASSALDLRAASCNASLTEKETRGCCALCCDCAMEMGVAWRGSELVTALRGGSASSDSIQKRRRSSRDRLGQCAASLASRSEELFLGLFVQLLVALEVNGQKEAGDSDEKDETDVSSVLTEALHWIVRRYPGNGLFLRLYAQALLNRGPSDGFLDVRRFCLSTLEWNMEEALRDADAPWQAVPPKESPVSPWPTPDTLDLALRFESSRRLPGWRRRVELYVQWACISNSLPFASLRRLPGGAVCGMPCCGVALTREEIWWTYTNALVCEAADRKDLFLELQTQEETSLARATWLCGRLLATRRKESISSGRLTEAEKNCESMLRCIEKEALVGVTQCPFSKRLWIFLLHFMAAKAAPASKQTETEGRRSEEEAAEETVLLLDEMIARGLNIHFDILAALAAVTHLPNKSRSSALETTPSN